MKKGMILLLCLVCLGLGACARPPRATEAAPRLIDADATLLEGTENTYTLYFRLEDKPYLAAESRHIGVERDQTTEMALVEQLIAGPSVTQTALQPLFPAGTEVMATSKQGEVLFVTFSEEFLSGYRAEKSDLTGESKKQAIRMERQLCLDALAATLTDAGLCTRVQVLVHRQQMKNNSLRLEEDYLYQNGSLLPLPEITRTEETLYTPHNAARYILNAWMTRNGEQLQGCIALGGMPAGQSGEEVLSQSLPLTGFQLANGHVSPDGQWAVVTAEITLHKNGSDIVRKGYPIRLCRENGVWKIPFDTLQSMMTEE